MKFYPLLFLSLISAPLKAQDIGYGPSLTYMHCPTWNLHLQTLGMHLQFPALLLDSNVNAIGINSSLSEFNPSIQNHAIGIIGVNNKTRMKLSLAQFGNSEFNLQAGLMGIQLKLSEKLCIGSEIHLAESRISNYKDLYILGTAIGICLQLHPSIVYINKLGFYGISTKENQLELHQEYIHVLNLKTKDMLSINLAMTKYLNQNQSFFSIGYLLQFKPQFSTSMTYQTGTKSIAVGLNLSIHQLQLNVESKYNQALGLSYLLGLSKHLHSNYKKQ
jgi:hypothetical protein